MPQVFFLTIYWILFGSGVTKRFFHISLVSTDNNKERLRTGKLRTELIAVNTSPEFKGTRYGVAIFQIQFRPTLWFAIIFHIHLVSVSLLYSTGNSFRPVALVCHNLEKKGNRADARNHVSFISVSLWLLTPVTVFD